jgi:hypothetical protein
MKKISLGLMVAFFITVLVSVTAWGETITVRWNFEGIVITADTAVAPTITGSGTVADSGSLTAGSSVTGLHASALTVWSTPSGNGSQKSLSSNHWGVLDYYQFLCSTTNYSGISITWSQSGSATGPRDFKVQFSTDGTNFINASGTNSTYAVASSPSWVSTSVSTASIRTLDLSGVSVLNNQSTVYIRLVDTSTVSINGGTVAATGTDRVDSVTVTAATVLPVELISFTALGGKNSVELAWNTATEVNNYGFEVERAIHSGLNGLRDWQKLGFVNGNGTSNAPRNYSFTDNSAMFGTYSYRLKQIDRNGNFEYSKEVEAAVTMTPNTMVLGQNYPNPFNPETSIEFAVPISGYTTLKVYNNLGEEIATLVNGNIEAGVLHQVTFKGSNFPSGLYFYILRSGSFVETKKMLMIK